MAQEKKRFRWWLFLCAAVCAVLLVPLAAALGLIETVGRRGTLAGRYERIQEGMSRTDVVRILGQPPIIFQRTDSMPEPAQHWDEGPVLVAVWFDEKNRVRVKSIGHFAGEIFVWWHVRRWAEKAYTAIHGPRR
jgi:hypothetical protein